jgi:hypothetical protein
MSAHGTFATSQDHGWTSAFGGRAVMHWTSRNDRVSADIGRINPAMQPKLRGHCQPPRSERQAAATKQETCRPIGRFVIVSHLPRENKSRPSLRLLRLALTNKTNKG